MMKLLSANILRLKKDKVFWISMAFMFAAGIFFPVRRYLDMKQYGTINNIDNGFFGCALFIGILLAVFCSLFIGTEYSDGTIRNKIIVGQSRTNIYLANFITCAAVGVLLCAVFFIPYLCAGIPLLGFFETDSKIILLIAATVFVLSAAFAAFYTLLAMLCQNKAVIAVVCVLGAFLLLIAGGLLYRRLSAPETLPAYAMSAEGEPQMFEEPNPQYLEGTKRDMVQFLYDFIPGGQASQCATMEIVNLPRLPLYSACIIVFCTGLGVFLFRKKDVR